MIVWCAYCQTFQGEQPPLNDYAMSHGVCAACEAKGAVLDAEAVRAIMPIADFYRALRERARAGTALPARDVLEQARALGIGPLDLLWGLLQPALHEIGELWSKDQVSVAIEHRFSMHVEGVVEALEQATAPAPATADLDFLLVAADGNHHTLGLRVVDLFLRARGRSTFVVVPGLPAHEVIALAAALKPKTLGVSAALPAHAASVHAILAGLPADRPRVVIGGHAVKMGVLGDLGPEATPIVDPKQLLEA